MFFRVVWFGFKIGAVQLALTAAAPAVLRPALRGAYVHRWSGLLVAAAPLAVERLAAHAQPHSATPLRGPVLR